MRRPYLAGNWKMNLSVADSVTLATAIRSELGSVHDRDVAIFPTSLALSAVVTALGDSPMRVGAQNCAAFEDGAYTGEVSASLCRSAGATSVLVGHSERRQILGESDEVVNAKMALALKAHLKPILCVGETQKEREAGLTLEVVERQVRKGLKGLTKDNLPSVTLAYEPVWAIGTGLVATPEQAQDVHHFIRGILREIAPSLADDLRILYGGSVKGSNVAGLMAKPDIDGALVGGASLQADEFLRIVRLGAN
ncbi:MAG TPA: triose-phosphate isomerase [Planctomycetota bacterium]|nr:triose-phosphate isomerase [Planctomycetota bacterium]